MSDSQCTSQLAIEGLIVRCEADLGHTEEHGAGVAVRARGQAEDTIVDFEWWTNPGDWGIRVGVDR